MLIVGSGAMACLMAARLAAQGTAVTVLAGWKEALDNLWRRGVHLQGSGHYQVEVLDKPGPRFREILLLTKGYQLEDKLDWLRHSLAPDGKVLSLLNGIGHEQILKRALGQERVEVGTTNMGATLLGPGSVRQGGYGHVFLKKESAFDTLEKTFVVERHQSLESVQWGKLVINSGINPVAALSGSTNGQLLTRPMARAWMRAAAVETAQVAQAKGIVLPFQDPVSAIESVARSTSSNRCSMLTDLCRKGPTEVDLISGAVVKAAAQMGLSAPINEYLWRAMTRAGGENS